MVEREKHFFFIGDTKNQDQKKLLKIIKILPNVKIILILINNLEKWKKNYFVWHLNITLKVGYHRSCHPDHNKGPDYAPCASP